MLPLTELGGAEVEGGGRQQLFFSASIANVGLGPFRIHAVRGDERGAWRISQRFLEPDGTTTELEVPGTMVWGGHGHNHWHVRVGASYELHAARGEIVRTLEKVGYCFFDQKPFDLGLEGAPRVPVYPRDTCSERSALTIDMGLSPGWEDPYTWALPDQRLEISGLPDGLYRLVARADPGGWFRETNEENNLVWVEFSLRTSVSPPSVRVLRRSP